jgi:hypothetical protein
VSLVDQQIDDILTRAGRVPEPWGHSEGPLTPDLKTPAEESWHSTRALGYALAFALLWTVGIWGPLAVLIVLKLRGTAAVGP